MKNEFQKFLKENDFLPLGKWNHFSLIHNKNNEKDKIARIKTAVGNNNGLYVYEKDNKIIYVGKAKPIFNRLKNHYLSSYQPVAGDTKDHLFHKFFKTYSRELKVYWKKQNDEKIRQIIEKMLDYVLNPEFNSFRANFKSKSK